MENFKLPGENIARWPLSDIPPTFFFLLLFRAPSGIRVASEMKDWLFASTSERVLFAYILIRCDEARYNLNIASYSRSKGSWMADGRQEKYRVWYTREDEKEARRERL